MTAERIQKMLARAGFGSRREIERWIEAGQVEVNGAPAKLGDKIGIDDAVKLKGQAISFRKALEFKPRVIAYHKPIGEIVSRDDPEGRTSVFEHLPVMKTSRWIAVGRLDINTSGLLLFTNDGELANKLMHPSSEVEREYAVRILGEVDNDMLTKMQKGVQLEDGMARFEDIKAHGTSEGVNQWYHVLLKEGRNREVRRIWESQGLVVSRLMRVRYGLIELDRTLRQSRWRDLDARECTALYKLVGLEPPEFDSGSKRPHPGSPWAHHVRHKQKRGR